MRIEHVKPSQRKKGRFLVTLEGGEVLRCSEDELLKFGLRPDMELSDKELEALRSSAKASSVRTQAANIIGSRPLSKKELTERLVKKGAEREDAESAADWLQGLGAVDDAQYAAMLARHYGGRGYGPQRVREELRRRGVDRQLWENAMESMPDREEILDGLVRKRGRDLSDPKEVKRLSDSLLRRGFAWGEVRDALRRYTDILEDDL